MPSLAPTVSVLREIFPDAPTSTAFRALYAVERIRAGEEVADVARSLRLRPAALTTLAGTADPTAATFGCSFADSGSEHPKNRAARRNLGQLVLGHVAEQVFERLYRREVGTDELALEDSRDDRNDTDYRVLNGRSRPVFLEAADWRALSATRANRLLRELLFERVYAVRVRGFAQNYRNAELDMHFSLTSDLTALHDFFGTYKEGGLHLLASKLSRGDI